MLSSPTSAPGELKLCSAATASASINTNGSRPAAQTGKRPTTHKNERTDKEEDNMDGSRDDQEPLSLERQALTPMGTMSTRSQFWRMAPMMVPSTKPPPVNAAARPATKQAIRPCQQEIAGCACAARILWAVDLTLAALANARNYTHLFDYEQSGEYRLSPNFSRLFSRRKYTEAAQATASWRPGVPVSVRPLSEGCAVSACAMHQPSAFVAGRSYVDDQLAVWPTAD